MTHEGAPRRHRSNYIPPVVYEPFPIPEVDARENLLMGLKYGLALTGVAGAVFVLGVLVGGWLW